MPALETSDCTDDAVLWTRNGADVNSNPTLDTPIRLKVRWVDKASSTMDPKNTVIGLDAQIAVANCMEIPVDSIVWHGNLGDIPGTAENPVPDADLYQVKSSSVARDIKGRVCRREYGLKRFGDTLPEVLR